MNQDGVLKRMNEGWMLDRAGREGLAGHLFTKGKKGYSVSAHVVTSLLSNRLIDWNTSIDSFVITAAGKRQVIPVDTRRVVLWQAKSWDRAIRDHSAYSDQHCCFCGRETKPDAVRLRVVRTNDGEWWVKPIGESALPDEKDFGECPLPIGPECLRKHPEFKIGIIY